MWNHRSLSLLHKHTQMVGGKYYFILSIFKSGDDRKREREKDTCNRCGFGLSGGVCVRLTSSYNLVITLMIDRERERESKVRE